MRKARLNTTVRSFDLEQQQVFEVATEVETYCGPPGYSGNPSTCPSTFSTSTSNAYDDGSGHLNNHAIDRATTATAIPPPFFHYPKTRVWLPITMAGFLVTLVVAPIAFGRRTSPYACTLFAGLTLTAVTTFSCGGSSSSSAGNPPPPPTKSWFSARMKTQGLENFQYGRIEASIQLPNTTDQGLWPAFWSLGSDIIT